MAVSKCSSSVTVIKFDRIVKIQVLVLEFITYTEIYNDDTNCCRSLVTSRFQGKNQFLWTPLYQVVYFIWEVISH